MSFPKTIYQTWCTKLPDSIQRSVDNMLRLNPDYQYQLFDDNDMGSFIEQNYESDVLEAYNLLKIGAAKADFWRYLVLYKNGGIYLDIDSVITNNLDSLITENCSIVSRENNAGLFVQWCLMFTPGHGILGNCINICLDNILNKKVNNILQLTGPPVYSFAIKKFFNNDEIYDCTDDEVNAFKSSTQVKFYSYDYKGYAEFQHPNREDLYTFKMHWREEQELLGGPL